MSIVRRDKSYHKAVFRPGVVPNAYVRATSHPNAAYFPEVGMTLSAYRHDAFRSFAPPKLNFFQRLRAKVTVKRLVLVLVAMMSIFIGWMAWRFVVNESKIFGGNIFGLLHATKLRGEDVGRVNILLAGNSADDPGHDGANLTDSIMIISVDTRDNTAQMLSIPRDLWVSYGTSGCPLGDQGKINGAYVCGENMNFNEAGYFPGGMGQLQKVIQQNFQIPINYYALIDYDGIKDAVNAVGGIDVNIKSCDPRGLYDPNIDYATGGPLVKLSNGVHHVDGEQALDLARARGDPSPKGIPYGFCGSDFTREEDQRMMLTALKSKATNSSVIANPVKITQLMNAAGKNIHTDFQTDEVRRLYDLSKLINNNSIKSLSLDSLGGKDMLKGFMAPGGADALEPAAGPDDYSEIDLYLKRALSSDPIAKEAASIAVLNGTNTYGLAAKEQKNLEGRGLNVIDVNDASSTVNSTTIIDNSKGKKPATRQQLITMYGSNVTTTNPYAAKYDADFIVIIGDDRVLSNP